MMSADHSTPLSVRLRPTISRVADKVRRQIGRVDNAEVRKARTLARLAREGRFDILLLGDSTASFTAPYDSDKRPLHRMLQDSFAPGAVLHAVHGRSYNPLLYRDFVRMLEAHPGKPLVIVPLTPRLRTLPWNEHPVHGHQRASRFLSTVGPTTPLRRIRKGFTPVGPEDFAPFHALEFPTWAGDLTIGDYVRPLKGQGLGEDDSARLMYAYHYGGEVEPGAPLDTVRELGELLRKLDLPVVVYQTPVPFEKGVELHGAPFRELAERNFAVLEDTFVSGYGDVPVLRTGFTAPTSHFIDWRDGSEHLNEHGRSTVAAAVVDAAAVLR